jgi:hypothetical protein
VITFASLPKPFVGHFGVIQRNAIRSWARLNPKPEILLFGTDEGVAEMAAEVGATHVPQMLRNEFNTPLIHNILDEGQKRAKNDIFCFINADIFLFPEFMDAVQRVTQWAEKFLMIGDTHCLDLDTEVDFNDPQWEEKLRARTLQEGKWRVVGMDYFVFRKNEFSHMPPFAVRPYFDNWFVWDARKRNTPVIDASKFVLSIHQNHPYPPMVGQQPGMHKGTEAQINLELLGGKDHAYRLMESDYVMSSSGVIRPSLYGKWALRMKGDAIKRKIKRMIIKVVMPLKRIIRK